VNIVLYSIDPVAALIAAATIAVFFKRLRSIIQHLAAGVFASAVAIKLIPDLMQRHSPVPMGVAFALVVPALVILSKSAGTKNSATVPVSISRSYVACIIGVDLACLIFYRRTGSATNYGM